MSPPQTRRLTVLRLGRLDAHQQLQEAQCEVADAGTGRGRSRRPLGGDFWPPRETLRLTVLENPLGRLNAPGVLRLHPLGRPRLLGVRRLQPHVGASRLQAPFVVQQTAAHPKPYA